MHIHLDPVGGIAGDMFAAALLDLRPELEKDLRLALETAGFGAIVQVAREPFNDGVLSGSRFNVTPSKPEAHDHHHRHYREVVALFNDGQMPDGVRARALDMFRVLAEAEAAVHDRALEDVAFHEVGAWDSIADVMAAAWLVEALAVDSWSCAPIPIGGGRVQTAHGELAVPAPATTLLLRNFPMHDDGRPGERVTPTGAAILKHLRPGFEPLPVPMTLTGTGSGFGTRKLRDMSNVLRALAFEASSVTGATVTNTQVETLDVCEFEVDDQTPEDLAVGVQHLRAVEGVLDVVQTPVYGKKGRMMVHIRVLSRPGSLDAVIAASLNQTSTLGVRHHSVQRTCLARDEGLVVEHAVRFKQVTRPAGEITRKAEMDDLAQGDNSRATRERLRREVETPHAGHHETKEPLNKS
ncbi:MAG: hypothetical protein ACI9DC_003741 [Gammaproteobacteria bacterium]|jgi:uncharacterized protein (TIGR00299 family) protein